LKVHFWGVRGSIPAPGPETNRYGGNTSCVSVIDSSGHLCVIDLGTGVVGLGSALMSGSLPVDGDFAKGEGQSTVLLSHAHWDHIQGFPFFAPIFVQGNEFHVIGNAHSSERVEALLEGQMNPNFSPIYTLKNLGATIEFRGIVQGQETRAKGLTVRAIPLPHGKTTALGFRLSEKGASVCYMSDVGYPDGGPDEDVVDFCRDADLLIHDSTYTPEERKAYRERGLSSYAEAVDLAVRAGVKTLALFHYDQDHSDEQVDAAVEAARALVKKAGARLEVIGASEGLQVDV
jgi:ribonuclease Z